MPDNKDDNKDEGIKSSPVYKGVLAKLAEQDAKIDKLIAENKELIEFNRALLGGTGEATPVNKQDNKAELEKKLNGGLKYAKQRTN